MERLGKHNVWLEEDCVLKMFASDSPAFWANLIVAERSEGVSAVPFAPKILSKTSGEFAWAARARGPSIVFERFGVNLFEFCKAHGKLDEERTREVYRVVRLMHLAGIAHNDLHPRNVLARLDEDGKFEARICDFDKATHKGELVTGEQALDKDALFEQNCFRNLLTRKRGPRPF